MTDYPSASEYILDNFKSSDRVALLLRHRTTEEVIQRIASAEKIAAPDFQQWLTERNQAGFDIYIGMNALKDGAYSRTKRDISEIRHVYLDLDYRGPEALKTIQNSQEVPKPNFVLDTSPGKRNWWAKMPDDARKGDKGSVVVRFGIQRDGTLLGKGPTVEVSSGTKSFDNVAINAIRASAPFEHLPESFKGPNIELRLHFYYNIPMPEKHP